MANVLAFSPSVELVEHECGECGIVFAMPKKFDQERLRDHSKGWYCPNGHVRVYAGKTEAEKLREQLAERDRLLAAERARAATNYAAREKAERALKKIQKRTSGGVCPCCNRTFNALGRHMKTKHPDFAAE